MKAVRDSILRYENGQKDIAVRRAYNNAIFTKGPTNHITAYLSAGGRNSDDEYFKRVALPYREFSDTQKRKREEAKKRYFAKRKRRKWAPKRKRKKKQKKSLHETYPPGTMCYVKVIEEGETYYVPAVLANDVGTREIGPNRARVLYITPSDDNEQHGGTDLGIGTDEDENIRDILYNQFDNNLEEVYEHDLFQFQENESDYDGPQGPYYTSTVYTVEGFKKENGGWVEQGAEHTEISSDAIRYWIEDGGSWGEHPMGEVAHRNAIVNGFLEETVDLNEMIDGAASSNRGVEVDAKDIIIGEEEMDKFYDTTRKRWYDILWEGPFQLR